MTDAVVCGGVPGKPQKIVCIKRFFAKHKKMNSSQKNVFQQKKNWTVPPSHYLLSISTKNSVC
jgi:hypothetical protein